MPDKSQDRQDKAPKKPVVRPRGKTAAQEARLAEALRANLRRRKSGCSGGEDEQNKKED